MSFSTTLYFYSITFIWLLQNHFKKYDLDLELFHHHTLSLDSPFRQFSQFVVTFKYYYYYYYSVCSKQHAQV